MTTFKNDNCIHTYRKSMNQPYPRLCTKCNEPEKIDYKAIEEIANEEFKNVGDEGLFPNHSDKDIWMCGFVHAYLLKK